MNRKKIILPAFYLKHYSNLIYGILTKRMGKMMFSLLFIAIFLMSCDKRGPAGPQGPEGPAGADGLTGQIFEVPDVSFAAPDYTIFVNFPAEVVVDDSDIVMAYIREDEMPDIWKPLPKTVLLGGGDFLLYDYDHTFFDINFYLDGTVDLAGLDPSDTDNITFRVAVIPAELAEMLDLGNFNQVMDALQIEHVHKIN